MARTRKVDRKDRVPFGTMKSKLTLDAQTTKKLAEAGKVPRVINDDGSMRIAQALQGGYEFVVSGGETYLGDSDGSAIPDCGSLIKKYVGKNDKGEPMYGYVMAIDKELYEEDKAAKEAVNKKVDDAIRGGTLANGSTEKIPGKGETFIKQVDYRP